MADVMDREALIGALIDAAEAQDAMSVAALLTLAEEGQGDGEYGGLGMPDDVVNARVQEGMREWIARRMGGKKTADSP